MVKGLREGGVGNTGGFRGFSWTAGPSVGSYCCQRCTDPGDFSDFADAGVSTDALNLFGP